MPPRRKPLQRTPLAPARSRAKTVGRVSKVRPRPADTGPTRAQRYEVIARAGARCEICGHDLTDDVDFSIHHRQPRGMGGNPAETNTPDRLLLLCGSGTSGCHGMVESQRALAYANGWLVRRPTDPADVPVDLWHGRYLLTRDGGYQEAS